MPHSRRRPVREHRSAALTALVLTALVLLVAGVTWGYLSWQDDVAQVSDEGRSDANPNPDDRGTSSPGQDAADGPVMLVIGDLFRVGSDPGWADRLGNDLGWVVYDVEVPSYLSASGRDRFKAPIGDAAEIYAPDVVVISGGRVDRASTPDEVGDAALSAVREAQHAFPEAKVVLLSPFSSGPPDDDLKSLRQAIGHVAQTTHVPFVDVTSMLSGTSIAGDNVHPTVDGTNLLADRIGEALVGDGVLYDATD